MRYNFQHLTTEDEINSRIEALEDLIVDFEYLGENYEPDIEDAQTEILYLELRLNSLFN